MLLKGEMPRGKIHAATMPYRPGHTYDMRAFDPTAIKQEFPIFTANDRNRDLCYLDNAAMAQMPADVIDQMVAYDEQCRANVKRGVHRLAESATEAFEGARETVARYLGVENADEVIFTGGTTSGINLLAQSFSTMLQPGDEIVLSELEHHSNIIPWQFVRRALGVNLRVLPMDAAGRLDLSHIDRCFTRKTRLIAVTHASNVTGAITDVNAVAGAAKACGAKLILDGAQFAPHGPFDLPGLKADFYVFSGHKVYGPSGIGVLWGRMPLLEQMAPGFGGGGMVDEVDFEKCTYQPPPQRFEAGTPPITQAVGLSAALKWLSNKDLLGLRSHLADLALSAMKGLTELGKGKRPIRIPGPGMTQERLPLVSFHIEGLHCHDICQVLSDRHNVAVRGGHHCAQPLHKALGLEASTRLSLAAFNNVNDIETFLNGIEDCMRFLG